jgi:hypothetical protein
MSVDAEKPLGFSLAGGPLGPGYLVSIQLPKFHQVFSHSEHRNLIYGMKPPTITEYIDGKQKETHA